MSSRASLGILFVLVSTVFFTAQAQEGLVEIVAEGCKEEIETLCSTVKPGDGRILACLYAHGDQVSSRCEYAVYEASAQLERAVAAFTYIASECDADLEALCTNVEAGEGRLLACLSENQAKISERCNTALSDVESL